MVLNIFCYAEFPIMRPASNFVREKKSLATPAVNFINILQARFLYKSLYGSFFLVTFWQKSTFVQKRRT